MDYLKEITDSIQEVTDVDLLADQSRRRTSVDARRIYCYIADKLQLFKLYEIGNHVGITHATVICHIQACKDLMQTDKAFNSKVLKCSAISPVVTRHDWLSKQYQYHLLKAKEIKIQLEKLQS